MNEGIEEMLTMYERGGINRRQFLNGLLLASLAPSALAQPSQAMFSGRVINHVTLSVTDVNRSLAFYQGLLGATVIGRQPNSKAPLKSADLRIGNSFIGIYPMGQPTRIDHFCVGIDNYDADKVMAQLQHKYAVNKPNLAGDKEVYLTDPDGIRLQLSAVNLKL